MTLLHDYFHTRNLQAFQRLLDGSNERGHSAAPLPTSGTPGSSYTGGGGGGGGKSWNRTGGVMYNPNAYACDVNARDWLGRTVLHLVCTSLESIEYARALLKHPNIDVNLPDTESMWTPLHRALYSANLPVALLLLQRSDLDTRLKDLEGYTAFDLYNSTVNATKPDPEQVNAELYTWGFNKNAALGLSDADDRVYPEHVAIKPKEDAVPSSDMPLSARFSPIPVRQILMSKLHTVVVTGESEGNIRLCGFGSGGRLGQVQHTQYSLKALPYLPFQVKSVAVGQDHTLALTTSGDVYSWGLNRFSQLGYVVELSSTATARHEEPIQSVPKRVVGPLRREIVCGVAASKNASACWTKETVFTWGTNTGQLGYDKNAQPVQVTPRPVTKFSNTVIDLAMSDTVLVGLLVTHHVECIWNDRQYRISFPMHAFPTGIEPYRPPQSIRDSWISKVVCCDDTFAALSSNGEVFTFSSPNSSADVTSGDGRSFKPQRIWALKKKFSAVKDVALGSDGSIIICTESGHVFVRTRNVKNASGKAFKFERVPYLQRVTRVCANSTGAFGALKVDYKPKPIEVVGNMISQDIRTVQPYLDFYRSQDDDLDEGNGNSAPTTTTDKLQGLKNWRRKRAGSVADVMFDDEPDDVSIEADVFRVLELCEVLECEKRMRKAAGEKIIHEGQRLPHGADGVVVVQSSVFPVHSVVLAARSTVLKNLLAGGEAIVDPRSNLNLKLLPAGPRPGPGIPKLTRLAISGCHPLSVLIFLQYLYSDEVLAVWDRRVSTSAEYQLSSVNANPAMVKTDLQALAKLLELTALSQALEAPVKREPTPSMAQDMKRLFDDVQKPHREGLPYRPDVVLLLADREVYCHSVVLRARSPLFASFFDLEDWTAKRWEADGMVHVNMRHLSWHVMRFVMGFMCCGADAEMFYVLDFINTVEGLIQFMFEVLAAANELLLDRLVSLCSSVILAYSNTNNACYILADATHYHVQPLVEKLQEYISVNMESFLETRLLDEIPYALVKQLSKFVIQRQTEKSPFSRSDDFVKEMLLKHGDWLAKEDIPEIIVRSTNRPTRRDKDVHNGTTTTKISPPTPAKKISQKACLTFLAKAAVESSPKHGLRRPPSGDDIFSMDDTEAVPTPSQPQDAPSTFTMPMVASPPAWKSQGAPRVDMKTIMAEAAGQNKPASRQPSTQSHIPSPRATGTKAPQMTPLGKEPSTSTSTWPTPSKSSQKQGSAMPMNWRTNSNSENTSSRGVLPSTPPASSSLPTDGVRQQSTPALIPKVQGPGQPQPQPSPTTPARAQPPGLGPVIVPTRQTPSKSSPNPLGRNPTAGKAWAQTQPPPLPPPQTTTTSTPTKGTGKGVSFLAIQLSQQEQLAPIKDKRSLREIQDEERALQEEADFLKWWTAEEERVQQEAQLEALALAQFQNQSQSKGGQSTSKNVGDSQGNKKNRNAGRPRGQPKPRADSTLPPAAAAAGGGGGGGQPEAGNSQTTENRPPPPPHPHPARKRHHHRPRPKTNADS